MKVQTGGIKKILLSLGIGGILAFFLVRFYRDSVIPFFRQILENAALDHGDGNIGNFGGFEVVLLFLGVVLVIVAPLMSGKIEKRKALLSIFAGAVFLIS